MDKIFEERKCNACGKTWVVEVKKHHKGKSNHCFCEECSKTLTPTEKNIYYKTCEGSHIVENRVCLNCGKEWKVLTAKDRIGKKIKKHYFCGECSKTLTSWKKKKIMKQKREGFKERMYEEKRRSRLNNIQYYIWTKAKQRAEKYGLDFNIDVSDIQIPDICPILEVPLTIPNDSDDFKIDPEKLLAPSSNFENSIHLITDKDLAELKEQVKELYDEIKEIKKEIWALNNPGSYYDY